MDYGQSLHRKELSRWLSSKDSACQQETQVRSLGWEDPLEEEMANPLKYSCLEEIPWTEEPGGLQSTGLQELDTTERLTLLPAF